MKINVIIDAGFKKQASPAWLRKISRLALAAEKAGTNVEMGIVITGDAEIHELTREYLDEDHPPGETFVVHAAGSASQQGYTPFEGQELSGRVKLTLLRGEVVYDGANVVGPARGRYLRRPTA